MSYICFTIKSAAQFPKTLKQCNERYYFMLSFTNCMAHSADKVAEVNQHSEQMLDELGKEYLDILTEPTYPIWEYS